MLSQENKRKIAADAAAELTRKNPDYLITACPLCKKTLAPATQSKVIDISEIVAEAIVTPSTLKKNPERLRKTVKESAGIT
jgi:Fe-S oxidoreductase